LAAAHDKGAAEAAARPAAPARRSSRRVDRVELEKRKAISDIRTTQRKAAMVRRSPAPVNICIRKYS
jgi:hypothetical protein